jgi:TPP-dependent pyruvate/acetoin dehydrogenase alpha subunit
VIEDTTKIKLLKDMLRIRIFEERILKLIENKELELGFHLLMGHEAIVAGVSKALRKDDYITSNHRTLGRYLSRGGDARKIMAEIFGKETGLCQGRAGEMLIADKSVGLLFSSVTVAAGIPVAVGAALGIKHYKKTDQVVACFFGDGATCNGIFHEAMNVATVHKAPVIFVCENNGLSINIPQGEWMSTKTVAERGSAYGMPSKLVDGTDVEAVYKVASKAVKRARDGLGPTLIDAVAVRLRPHKEGLSDNRSPLETKKLWKKDPIELYVKKLIQSHVLNNKMLSEMKLEIKNDIEDAVNYARSSSFPNSSGLMENTYSEEMSDIFSKVAPQAHLT